MTSGCPITFISFITAREKQGFRSPKSYTTWIRIHTKLELVAGTQPIG